MLLAKVQSRVLSTARKELPVLNMYLSIFKITDQICFISEVKNKEMQLKAVLEDYFFNEKESPKLWDIAEKIEGKKTIDLKVIALVEL